MTHDEADNLMLSYFVTGDNVLCVHSDWTVSMTVSSVY